MIHRRVLVMFLSGVVLFGGTKPADAQAPPVAAPNNRLRVAGGVVTVAGVAVGGVGGALFLYAVPKRLAAAYGCDTPCDEPPFWFVKAGLIGMAGGAVLAVSGLIMIAASMDGGQATVSHLEPPPAGSWQVVPVMTARASGLAVVGRF